MKINSVCFFSLVAVAMATTLSFSYAAQTSVVTTQEVQTTQSHTKSTVNPAALQAFVDHPGFCAIFLGQNEEVEATVFEPACRAISVLQGGVKRHKFIAFKTSL